jgi:hypothetical protein
MAYTGLIKIKIHTRISSISVNPLTKGEFSPIKWRKSEGRKYKGNIVRKDAMIFISKNQIVILSASLTEISFKSFGHKNSFIVCPLYFVSEVLL